MDPEFIDLTPLRKRLGEPPRKVGFFSLSPLYFPEPPWLRGEQKTVPLKRLFAGFDQVWKEGRVLWGHVVRANANLFTPGTDDCPGLMIFSFSDSDETAVNLLPVYAKRLYDLRLSVLPNPTWTQSETEWWEDMTNDRSYQRGVKLPAAWQQEKADYRGSSIFFHRGHLPGTFIQSRLMPLLVNPKTDIAMPVPCSYWPKGMAEWLAAHHGRQEPITDSNAAKSLQIIAMEDREAAYQSVFGPIVSVLHELIPGPRHVDVYTFNWPAPRHEHAYVSGGMSDAEQPGGGAYARIELVFYAKHHAPWCSSFVRSFARCPWETGAAIGPWHTIPLGEHAEAVLDTARFPALMFFPGVAKSERSLHSVPLFAQASVRFLSIVPITQAELDFKRNAGTEALVAIIQEKGLDLAFDPDRPSLV